MRGLGRITPCFWMGRLKEPFWRGEQEGHTASEDQEVSHMMG